MEPGALIKTEREKRRWSQRDLADRVGVSQVAIMKIETGVTKKSKHFPKIAQVLGISLSELDASLSQQNFAMRKTENFSSVAANVPLYRVPAEQLLGEEDLPVFGASLGGVGVFVLSDVPFRNIARPQNLKGIKDAFGILIIGNSMAREYREGDIAYVDPNLIPRVGDACMFESEREGKRHVCVKYLEKLPDHSDDVWHVSQSNPERKFQLKKVDWKKCLVLVGKHSGR